MSMPQSERYRARRLPAAKANRPRRFRPGATPDNAGRTVANQLHSAEEYGAVLIFRPLVTGAMCGPIGVL